MKLLGKYIKTNRAIILLKKLHKNIKLHLFSYFFLNYSIIQYPPHHHHSDYLEPQKTSQSFHVLIVAFQNLFLKIYSPIFMLLM